VRVVMERQITGRSNMYGQHVHTEFVIRNDYRVVHYNQRRWKHKGISSNVFRFSSDT